ncbi:MAG TPA: hypothetical protein VEY30_12530 [Myxococcaceae bacterium]|nr:hypothetical protein [Myxococcaceae bacterium]
MNPSRSARGIRSGAYLLLIALLGGCSAEAPGSVEIAYPVFGRGVPAEPFTSGGWRVALTAAEVGFGPAYFCATAAASSDLCPVAVSQFARAAAINGLDPAPQPLGEADGESGTVRSAAYDFAVSWFTTQRSVIPSPRAPRGHSAYFEGTAVKEGRSVRFTAAVDVVPRFQDTRAVQGQPVNATLGGEGLDLTVAVNPRDWWTAVNFDEALGDAADGAVVEVVPGTRAYEAVVFGMVTARPPMFQWSSR